MDDKKIIAVDFDGTLFTDEYPNIGEPIMRTIQYCKKMAAAGNTLILWTCRKDWLLLEAVRACEKYGLQFDYVNCNTKEILEKYNYIDNRKIFAHIYLDDRSLRPDDLEEVNE